MNTTEKMLHEINEFLAVVGDAPIRVPLQPQGSELDFLRAVKKEYTVRLRAKVPAYQSLRSDATIPDLFLEALRDHESELEKRLR